MRLGFSTQEAYFTILGVLIVLSAIGTIIGLIEKEVNVE